MKKRAIILAWLLGATSLPAQTSLDPSPIISARGAAMSGALSTLADDFDASYYNPAGISGFHNGNPPGRLRKLNFPSIGVAANEQAIAFNRDAKDQDASTDRGVASALLDAYAGKRQYARTNMNLGMVLNRVLVLPFYDQQIAATSQGEGSDLVDMEYRSMSGVGCGLSATDPTGDMSIGVYSQYASISSIADTFEYLDFINKDRRQAMLKDSAVKYSGVSNTAGFNWRFYDEWSPRVAVVWRNAKGTEYKNLTDPEGDPMKVPQTVHLGFSLSPELSDSIVANTAVEFKEVNDKEQSFREKLSIGQEILFGKRPTGSYAAMALRAGWSRLGASFGASLNLGLLSLEAASYLEDVGADPDTGEHVIERRKSALVSINVAAP